MNERVRDKKREDGLDSLKKRKRKHGLGSGRKRENVQDCKRKKNIWKREKEIEDKRVR